MGRRLSGLGMVIHPLPCDFRAGGSRLPLLSVGSNTLQRFRVALLLLCTDQKPGFLHVGRQYETAKAF